MQHTESQIQRQCVTWFRIQYPRKKKILFAIPNGGKRKRVEAAIMSGEGVVAGVSDMVLAIQPTYFFEFKTSVGKQSQDQIEFQQAVEAQGYKYFIIRSLDEFRGIIEKIFS